MAEIKVSRQSSQQQPEERGRALARRGEFFPRMWSMHPRDLFSLSPFEMMRRFSEDMDRFFTGSGRETGEGGRLWAPEVEVREKGNNLIVCADLPGLSKDDVKIEITDDGLVIQGERKREQEERKEGYYRSERSYGQFYRLIPLPDEAKIDQARAQFNNGVLEVTVPIEESKRKRREIPIETEAKTRTSGGSA